MVGLKVGGIVNAINKVVEKLSAISIAISSDQKDYVCSVYPSSNSSNLSDNTFTKIIFNLKKFDPENCFDAENSKWVCPVSGFYDINLQVGYLNLISGVYLLSSVYKNGVSWFHSRGHSASTNEFNVLNQRIVYLEKGDYLEFYGRKTNSSATTVQITGNENATWLTIAKINKYSGVSSNGQNFEPCYFSAKNTTTTATAGGVATDIIFTVKEFDSDNAFDGKIFTVPSGKSGIYEIKGLLSASATSGVKFICWLYLNNSSSRILGRIIGSGDITSPNGSCLLRLNAGDKIKIVVQLFNAGATALTTNDGYAYFSARLIQK